MPWAEVKKEMVVEKGLPEDVADKIGEWVVLKGGQDLLDKLQKDESLAVNESMKQGMTDMGLLFDYLECYNATNAVSFDLSLARGLDYYTGIIFEGTRQERILQCSIRDANADGLSSCYRGLCTDHTSE